MRQLAAEWRSDLPCMYEWRARADFFLDIIAEDLSDANDLGGKLQKQSWDTWQKEALAGSARMMHRFTKQQRK
eukprot:4513596-Pyramimonas_sp.AAC.1